MDTNHVKFMPTYITEWRGFNYDEGYFATWDGDRIIAPSPKVAEFILHFTDKSYHQILGEWIEDIPCNENDTEVDPRDN